MKNVHLIPTDKPQVGCLVKYKDGVVGLIKGLTHNSHFKVHIPLEGISIENNDTVSTFNIYITSNEEIKDGWVLNTHNEIYFLKGFYGIQPITKKIILTTDEELQKDGVQAIDDEFLEWFVQNPSCEFVEVERGYLGIGGFVKSSEPLSKDILEYKIIIPQEEPEKLIGEKVMPLDNDNIEEEEETLEEDSQYIAIRFLEWYRRKNVFFQFHAYHIPNPGDKNWEQTVFHGDNSYLTSRQLFAIFKKETYE